MVVGSFSDYLKRYLDRNTAWGDFARDWERDLNERKYEVATRPQLRLYLMSLSACAEAITIGGELFSRYEKIRKRNQ
jgi:hypothetical protein